MFQFWQTECFFQAGDHCLALWEEAEEQHVLLQLINSAASRPLEECQFAWPGENKVQLLTTFHPQKSSQSDSGAASHLPYIQGLLLSDPQSCYAVLAYLSFSRVKGNKESLGVFL